MKDWLIILATILGPILAVQAQKYVERFHEKKNRKFNVFRSLMATRAARLSPEHVQSLNMIDLAFDGGPHRSRTEQAVLNSWKEYLDHLNSFDKANGAAWVARGADLFSNLLSAMSIDLGYSYDKVQLNKGAYSPMAHGEIENEQSAFRKLAIRVFGGEVALKMAVTELPAHPDALAALASQRATSEKLAAALDGGALKVRVDQQI